GVGVPKATMLKSVGALQGRGVPAEVSPRIHHRKLWPGVRACAAVNVCTVVERLVSRRTGLWPVTRSLIQRSYCAAPATAAQRNDGISVAMVPLGPVAVTVRPGAAETTAWPPIVAVIVVPPIAVAVNVAVYVPSPWSVTTPKVPLPLPLA